MPRAKYFSTIDLSKAFWQVPLSEDPIPNQFANSQELTAFVLPGRGLYQFTVMPFGLTNSPTTQNRLMYMVLGHDLEQDLEPWAYVYMDDILLMRRTNHQRKQRRPYKVTARQNPPIHADLEPIKTDLLKWMRGSCEQLSFVDVNVSYEVEVERNGDSVSFKAKCPVCQEILKPWFGYHQGKFQVVQRKHKSQSQVDTV